MPVYILRAGADGPVKIGRTSYTYPRGIVDRLTVVQTGNHELLHLIRLLDGHAALEMALFKRFAHLRVRASWYRFDEAMLGDLGAPDWPYLDQVEWPPLSLSAATTRAWQRRKAA